MTYVLDDRHLDEVVSPMGDKAPRALAQLRRSRSCWLWVILRCPLCGGRHQHGGGPLGRDPRRLLSHRCGHCANPPDWPNDGYVLIDADPDRTAMVIGGYRTGGAALRWDR